MKKALFLLSLAIGVMTLAGCRVTRHIPQDEEVVSRVHITVDGQPSSNNQLRMAVLQKPYHRTFGFLPISTWMWHNDIVTPFHRWRNKVGTAPDTYNDELSERTDRAMQRVLFSQGFLDAKVTHTTRSHKRKVTVDYNVERGTARRVATIGYWVEDPNLQVLVEEDSKSDGALLSRGMLLDRTLLEAERSRLTTMLRNHGYWDFNKDNVSYVADTVEGSGRVDLKVVISGMHDPYRFGEVQFVTNYSLLTSGGIEADDDLKRDLGDGYSVHYSGRRSYLRDATLKENCFVVPGEQYSERAVQDTYSALSRLHLLKYVNLRVEPSASDPQVLDVSVFLSPQNPHSIQLELDGTNTSGDLGFAASLTYQHRNLFRGSESYTATLKGGYESLTGNVAGLVNDNYTEYAFENRIDIPKFLFPLLSIEQRRRSRATTQINASYSYQSRPEYTRIITQGGLGYKWYTGSSRIRHTWDVIDLSYVYLPKRSEAFLKLLQNAGPISYSSYSSHFIMSMGYNLYMGNAGVPGMGQMSAMQKSRDVWSLRVNPEIAGNLMQGISQMAHLKKQDGQYVIFDQPFEQYARFDMDWSYSRYLTDRSRLAFHLAGGVAVPYGNSEVMPFEKRYYSGGANSVRGWSVRTLGPGRYRSKDSSLDYFNQCGDVRMDASVELRSKLFWKFEFAAFLDAGNVWTLHEYDVQPEGAFTSDFYKQIASSWGLGLRMVTDFVVLRLDLGVKAYDPSRPGRSAWVVDDPLSNHNRTLHFAVGYPF